MSGFVEADDINESAISLTSGPLTPQAPSKPYPTSTIIAGGWNSGGQNCEGGDGHMDRANGIPSGHHQ